MNNEEYCDLNTFVRHPRKWINKKNEKKTVGKKSNGFFSLEKKQKQTRNKFFTTMKNFIKIYNIFLKEMMKRERKDRNISQLPITTPTDIRVIQLPDNLSRLNYSSSSSVWLEKWWIAYEKKTQTYKFLIMINSVCVYMFLVCRQSHLR